MWLAEHAPTLSAGEKPRFEIATTNRIPLDLDTGKRSDGPDPTRTKQSTPGREVADFKAWAAEEGIDLLAESGTLIGLDLKTTGRGPLNTVLSASFWIAMGKLPQRLGY